jgi:uncharacterized protein DUF4440
MKRLSKALVAACALSAAFAFADAPPETRPASTPEDLFRAIAAQDAALFNAYNTCDLKKFASLLDEHVEFFHDHGGVTLGRAALTESVRKNICGSTTRELVAGSLEVYPMDNYGALEIGTHRFHHPKAEATEPVGEGKFVQLWHYDKASDTWQVTRVFSFDHRALPMGEGR